MVNETETEPRPDTNPEFIPSGTNTPVFETPNTESNDAQELVPTENADLVEPVTETVFQTPGTDGSNEPQELHPAEDDTQDHPAAEPFETPSEPAAFPQAEPTYDDGSPVAEPKPYEVKEYPEPDKSTFKDYAPTDTGPASIEATPAQDEAEVGDYVTNITQKTADEVAHADAAYKFELGVQPSPDVKEDLEDRIALAAAPHREVNKDELAVADPSERIQVEVGNDDDGDGTAEDLPQEVIVKDLAEAGKLFEKGGPLPNGELSDGVDGLFLAERSKQTGEKLF